MEHLHGAAGDRLFKAAVALMLGAVIGLRLLPADLRVPQGARTARCRRTSGSGSPGAATCSRSARSTSSRCGSRSRSSPATVMSSPFWLYQLWAFITPGLHKNEKRFAVDLRRVRHAAVPLRRARWPTSRWARAWQLLLSIAPGTVTALAGHQVPVLRHRDAAGVRRVVRVPADRGHAQPHRRGHPPQLRVAAAARSSSACSCSPRFATPSQDPFTMCAMALPMCLLFEGSLLVTRVHDRRKARREAADPLGLGPADRGRPGPPLRHQRVPRDRPRGHRGPSLGSARVTPPPGTAPRLAVVLNPAAGRGRGARVADAVVAAWRARGVAVRTVAGRDAAETAELVADRGRARRGRRGRGRRRRHRAPGAAVRRPAPRPRWASSRPAPATTWPSPWACPTHPVAAAEAVADALDAGTWRAVDLAEVSGPDGVERWYGCVLGAGFDSAVNERANQMRWPAGPRKYDVAVLAELRTFSAAAVHPDPRRRRAPPPRRCWWRWATPPPTAPGMRVCPDARLDDGLLDVTVLGAVSVATLMRLLPQVYRGTHVRHPAVTTYRAAARSAWPRPG